MHDFLSLFVAYGGFAESYLGREEKNIASKLWLRNFKSPITNSKFRHSPVTCFGTTCPDGKVADILRLLLIQNFESVEILSKSGKNWSWNFE